jgi:hypothetical protein
MVVLLFAAEIEILDELDAPNRDKILVEAAAAYRARADTYQLMNKHGLARLDVARAVSLETRAAKLKNGSGKEPPNAKRQAAKSGPMGRIRLVNAWKEPVSVVIENKSYYLLAGEEKEIVHTTGEFIYEIQTLQHWAKGQVEAGQTLTIRVRPR